MARTVLVPLIRPEEDIDGASAAALSMAQALAERLDADVVLVSVLDLPAEGTEDGGQRLLHAADAFPDDERLLAVKQQAEEIVVNLAGWLDEMAAQFPAGRAVTAIRYGDAGNELLRVAGMLEEPVVVMSSHARRGLSRAVVGSVAFKVVSEATYPVVIVPVVATGTPVHPEQLLAPLDGSLMAEYALDAGLALIGSGTHEIHLVQVVETLTVRSGMVADDYYAMAREEARQYLEGVTERLRAAGRTVEWSVRLGMPAQEIAAAAAEVDAGLIVMATHGRSGFKRAVLGSVAERVLHTAQRPLLLLRPTEDDLKATATRSSSD
jgi:nucleotide-binding universal stress UspA family protein